MIRNRKIIGDILYKLGVLNRFYLRRDNAYMYLLCVPGQPGLRLRPVGVFYMKYIHKYGL